MTWDSSRTVVVIKLRRTSALRLICCIPGPYSVYNIHKYFFKVFRNGQLGLGLWIMMPGPAGSLTRSVRDAGRASAATLVEPSESRNLTVTFDGESSDDSPGCQCPGSY